MDKDIACGIVAGKCDEFDENLPQKAYLLSMWVEPAYRRTGVGSRLACAVEQRARAIGVCDFRLMVAGKNSAAMRFYERCGFAFSAETRPYPNDPTIFERETAKSLRDW